MTQKLFTFEMHFDDNSMHTPAEVCSMMIRASAEIASQGQVVQSGLMRDAQNEQECRWIVEDADDE